MHKLDGNRTLAHSGGNALDRTVTHVAGYLLAGLAPGQKTRLEM